jgi:hypothetical protein
MRTKNPPNAGLGDTSAFARVIAIAERTRKYVFILYVDAIRKEVGRYRSWKENEIGGGIHPLGETRHHQSDC